MLARFAAYKSPKDHALFDDVGAEYQKTITVEIGKRAEKAGRRGGRGRKR
jgi:hypothetical protein